MYFKNTNVVAPMTQTDDKTIEQRKFPEVAEQIVNELKYDFNVAYDEKDAVGRRYRRQDAVGTPFCVTVDHQTLEDNTVTLRHRDTMEQVRIAIPELRATIAKEVDMRN